MMSTLASRRSYADSVMSSSLQMTNDIDSPGVSASSSGDTVNSTIDTLPRTPQGLRGRKSAATIRRELGLQRRQLDWLPPVSRNYETTNGDKFSASHPMLPPMLPSTSITSPQVSTSSFYTHSSNSAAEDVARSPSLIAGQARTAVGALLANSQHSFHGTDSSILSSASALQSRNWADHQGSGMSKGINDVNSEYESMASQRILPTRHRLDEESFSHASPSSDYHRNTAANILVASNLETSFSRSFAVDNFEHHVPKSMNTMEGNDFFVRNAASTQDLNVSGMSQSTKDIESLVGYGLDEEILSHCEDMIGSDRQDFNSLGFSRAQGQRFDRDDLLFSTIERLQDNVSLVKEIMGASSQGGRGGSLSLLTNSMPCVESFFAGFSQRNRDAICSIIENIIQDRPSTFQRISQHKDDFEQALRFISALVRISVPASEKRMTVFKSSSSGLRQEGQWRCMAGFRASIGFVEEPKSPDTIRGGDTSLFSLPSETATATTPHTSNVSVTTTITSAFSPDKPEGIQKNNLRQTLETVVTLFERLAKCCNKLTGETFASSNIAVMAAEEITRIYLQVHTISIDNLEALVDSFELDIPSQLQIQRSRTEKLELPLNLPSTISHQEPSALNHATNAAPQTAAQGKSIESRDDQGYHQNTLPQTLDTCNGDTITRESEAIPVPDRLDEQRDAPPSSVVAAPTGTRGIDRKKVRRTRLWRRRLVPKRRTAE